MKKLVWIVLITLFGLQAQAQTGDLTMGAQGGYMFKYKGIMYGLDLCYQPASILEVSISGLMNSKIHMKDPDFQDASFDRDVSFYSGNLDLRFLLINSDLLATGPVLGGQCANFTIKDPSSNNSVVDEGTAWGANIGWHLRVMIAENLKLNGGWRYTSATEDQKYHTVYLGIGYSFNLF